MAVIKKLIAVLAIAFTGLILVSLTSPVKAASDSNREHIVYDQAKLFSTDETAKINKAMNRASYKTLVVTTKEDTDDMHAQAESFYEQIFGNKSSSGICLIINMKKRQVYLAAFGGAKDKLNSADNRDVTDNIYRYLSNGAYAKGTIAALNQCKDIIDRRFVSRPLRMIEALLLGILLGFLAMFGIAYVSRANFNQRSGQVPDDIEPNYSNALVAGEVDGSIINRYTTVRTEYKVHSSDHSGDNNDFSDDGDDNDFSSSGGGHGF